MAIECPKCQFDNPDDTIYCGKCATLLQPDHPGPTRTIQMPSLDLSAGQVFAGRYEVITELGRGGMGRVYKVKDTQINEEMALKLLKPEIAADEGKTIGTPDYISPEQAEGKDADPGIAEIENAKSHLGEFNLHKWIRD